MALHNTFFSPKFNSSLQPFDHVFLPTLNRSTTLSLLAAFNVTHCKSADGLPQLLPTFQVLIFLHTTKNWKDNRLLLTYLRPKFHLRKYKLIYLNWQSEWKIPVEKWYFQKGCNSLICVFTKNITLLQVFFKHFVSANQLITLRANELNLGLQMLQLNTTINVI